MKVFLVEDNPDHVALIRHSLRDCEHDIIHYADGASLLDFLTKKHLSEELPALIFLDLKLPRLDGFEILNHLQTDPVLRLIPVVILTTSKYRKDIHRAYELGAKGFLVKQDELPELSKRLRNTIHYWLETVEHPILA